MTLCPICYRSAEDPVRCVCATLSAARHALAEARRSVSWTLSRAGAEGNNVSDELWNSMHDVLDAHKARITELEQELLNAKKTTGS